MNNQKIQKEHNPRSYKNRQSRPRGIDVTKSVPIHEVKGLTFGKGLNAKPLPIFAKHCRKVERLFAKAIKSVHNSFGQPEEDVLDFSFNMNLCGRRVKKKNRGFTRLDLPEELDHLKSEEGMIFNLNETGCWLYMALVLASLNNPYFDENEYYNLEYIKMHKLYDGSKKGKTFEEILVHCFNQKPKVKKFTSTTHSGILPKYNFNNLVTFEYKSVEDLMSYGEKYPGQVMFGLSRSYRQINGKFETELHLDCSKIMLIKDFLNLQVTMHKKAQLYNSRYNVFYGAGGDYFVKNNFFDRLEMEIDTEMNPVYVDAITNHDRRIVNNTFSKINFIYIKTTKPSDNLLQNNTKGMDKNIFVMNEQSLSSNNETFMRDVCTIFAFNNVQEQCTTYDDKALQSLIKQDWFTLNNVTESKYKITYEFDINDLTNNEFVLLIAPVIGNDNSGHDNNNILFYEIKQDGLYYSFEGTSQCSLIKDGIDLIRGDNVQEIGDKVITCVARKVFDCMQVIMLTSMQVQGYTSTENVTNYFDIPVFSNNLLTSFKIPTFKIERVNVNKSLLERLIGKNLNGNISHETLLQYGMALSWYSYNKKGIEISNVKISPEDVKTHVYICQVLCKRQAMYDEILKNLINPGLTNIALTFLSAMFTTYLGNIDDNNFVHLNELLSHLKEPLIRTSVGNIMENWLTIDTWSMSKTYTFTKNPDQIDCIHHAECKDNYSGIKCICCNRMTAKTNNFCQCCQNEVQCMHDCSDQNHIEGNVKCECCKKLSNEILCKCCKTEVSYYYALEKPIEKKPQTQSYVNAAGINVRAAKSDCIFIDDYKHIHICGLCDKQYMHRHKSQLIPNLKHPEFVGDCPWCEGNTASEKVEKQKPQEKLDEFKLELTIPEMNSVLGINVIKTLLHECEVNNLVYEDPDKKLSNITFIPYGKHIEPMWNFAMSNEKDTFISNCGIDCIKHYVGIEFSESRMPRATVRKQNLSKSDLISIITTYGINVCVIDALGVEAVRANNSESFACIVHSSAIDYEKIDHWLVCKLSRINIDDESKYAAPMSTKIQHEEASLKIFREKFSEINDKKKLFLAYQISKSHKFDIQTNLNPMNINDGRIYNSTKNDFKNGLYNIKLDPEVADYIDDCNRGIKSKEIDDNLNIIWDNDFATSVYINYNANETIRDCLLYLNMLYVNPPKYCRAMKRKQILTIENQQVIDVSDCKLKNGDVIFILNGTNYEPISVELNNQWLNVMSTSKLKQGIIYVFIPKQSTMSTIMKIYSCNKMSITQFTFDNLLSNAKATIGYAGTGKTTLLCEWRKNNPKKKTLFIAATSGGVKSLSNKLVKMSDTVLSFEKASYIDTSEYTTIVMDEATLIKPWELALILSNNTNEILLYGDPLQIGTMDLYHSPGVRVNVNLLEYLAKESKVVKLTDSYRFGQPLTSELNKNPALSDLRAIDKTKVTTCDRHFLTHWNATEMLSLMKNANVILCFYQEHVSMIKKMLTTRIDTVMTVHAFQGLEADTVVVIQANLENRVTSVHLNFEQCVSAITRSCKKTIWISIGCYRPETPIWERIGSNIGAIKSKIYKLSGHQLVYDDEARRVTDIDNGLKKNLSIPDFSLKEFSRLISSYTNLIKVIKNKHTDNYLSLQLKVLFKTYEYSIDDKLGSKTNAPEKYKKLLDIAVIGSCIGKDDETIIYTLNEKGRYRVRILNYIAKCYQFSNIELTLSNDLEGWICKSMPDGCAACGALQLIHKKDIVTITRDYFTTDARFVSGDKSNVITQVLNNDPIWNILDKKFDDKELSHAILTERIKTAIVERPTLNYLQCMWYDKYENNLVKETVNRQLNIQIKITQYDKMDHLPFFSDGLLNHKVSHIENNERIVTTTKLNNDKLHYIYLSLCILHEKHKGNFFSKMLAKSYMWAVGAEDRLAGMEQSIQWHKTNKTQVYRDISNRLAKLQIKKLKYNPKVVHLPSNVYETTRIKFAISHFASNNRTSITDCDTTANDIVFINFCENVIKFNDVQAMLHTSYASYVLNYDCKVTYNEFNNQQKLTHKMESAIYREMLNQHYKNLPADHDDFAKIKRQLEYNDIYNGKQENATVLLTDGFIMENVNVFNSMLDKYECIYGWLPANVNKNQLGIMRHCKNSNTVYKIDKILNDCIVKGNNYFYDNDVIKIQTLKTTNDIIIFKVDKEALNDIWIEPQAKLNERMLMEIPKIIIDPTMIIREKTILSVDRLILNVQVMSNLRRRLLRPNTTFNDLLIQARTLFNTVQFTNIKVNNKFDVSVADMYKHAQVAWLIHLCETRKYSLINEQTDIKDTIRTGILTFGIRLIEKFLPKLDVSNLNELLEYHADKHKLIELMSNWLNNLDKLRLTNFNERRRIRGKNLDLIKFNFNHPIFHKVRKLLNFVEKPMQTHVIKNNLLSKCDCKGCENEWFKWLCGEINVVKQQGLECEYLYTNECIKNLKGIKITRDVTIEADIHIYNIYNKKNNMGILLQYDNGKLLKLKEIKKISKLPQDINSGFTNSEVDIDVYNEMVKVMVFNSVDCTFYADAKIGIKLQTIKNNNNKVILKSTEKILNTDVYYDKELNLDKLKGKIREMGYIRQLKKKNTFEKELLLMETFNYDVEYSERQTSNVTYNSYGYKVNDKQYNLPWLLMTDVLTKTITIDDVGLCVNTTNNKNCLNKYISNITIDSTGVKIDNMNIMGKVKLDIIKTELPNTNIILPNEYVIKSDFTLYACPECRMLFVWPVELNTFTCIHNHRTILIAGNKGEAYASCLNVTSYGEQNLLIDDYFEIGEILIHKAKNPYNVKNIRNIFVESLDIEWYDKENRVIMMPIQTGKSTINFEKKKFVDNNNIFVHRNPYELDETLKNKVLMVATLKNITTNNYVFIDWKNALPVCNYSENNKVFINNFNQINRARQMERNLVLHDNYLETNTLLETMIALDIINKTKSIYCKYECIHGTIVYGPKHLSKKHIYKNFSCCSVYISDYFRMQNDEFEDNETFNLSEVNLIQTYYKINDKFELYLCTPDDAEDESTDTNNDDDDDNTNDSKSDFESDAEDTNSYKDKDNYGNSNDNTDTNDDSKNGGKDKHENTEMYYSNEDWVNDIYDTLNVQEGDHKYLNKDIYQQLIDFNQDNELITNKSWLKSMRLNYGRDLLEYSNFHWVSKLYTNNPKVNARLLDWLGRLSKELNDKYNVNKVNLHIYGLDEDIAERSPMDIEGLHLAIGYKVKKFKDYGFEIFEFNKPIGRLGASLRPIIAYLMEGWNYAYFHCGRTNLQAIWNEHRAKQLLEMQLVNDNCTVSPWNVVNPYMDGMILVRKPSLYNMCSYITCNLNYYTIYGIDEANIDWFELKEWFVNSSAKFPYSVNFMGGKMVELNKIAKKTDVLLITEEHEFIDNELINDAVVSGGCQQLVNILDNKTLKIDSRHNKQEEPSALCLKMIDKIKNKRTPERRYASDLGKDMMPEFLFNYTIEIGDLLYNPSVDNYCVRSCIMFVLQMHNVSFDTQRIQSYVCMKPFMNIEEIIRACICLHINVAIFSNDTLIKTIAINKIQKIVAFRIVNNFGQMHMTVHEVAHFDFEDIKEKEMPITILTDKVVDENVRVNDVKMTTKEIKDIELNLMSMKDDNTTSFDIVKNVFYRFNGKWDVMNTRVNCCILVDRYFSNGFHQVNLPEGAIVAIVNAKGLWELRLIVETIDCMNTKITGFVNEKDYYNIYCYNINVRHHSYKNKIYARKILQTGHTIGWLAKNDKSKASIMGHKWASSEISLTKDILAIIDFDNRKHHNFDHRNIVYGKIGSGLRIVSDYEWDTYEMKELTVKLPIRLTIVDGKPSLALNDEYQSKYIALLKPIVEQRDLTATYVFNTLSYIKTWDWIDSKQLKSYTGDKVEIKEIKLEGGLMTPHFVTESWFGKDSDININHRYDKILKIDIVWNEAYKSRMSRIHGNLFDLILGAKYVMTIDNEYLGDPDNLDRVIINDYELVDRKFMCRIKFEITGKGLQDEEKILITDMQDDNIKVTGHELSLMKETRLVNLNEEQIATIKTIDNVNSLIYTDNDEIKEINTENDENNCLIVGHGVTTSACNGDIVEEMLSPIVMNYWDDETGMVEGSIPLPNHDIKMKYNEEFIRLNEKLKCTMTQYPTHSQPAYTSRYGAGLQAISELFGGKIVLRKVEHDPKVDADKFVETYFLNNSINNLPAVNLDYKKIITWLRERPDALSIADELIEILSEGLDVRGLDRVNIHMKLESRMKDKLINLLTTESTDIGMPDTIEEQRVRLIVWQRKGITAIFASFFLDIKENLKRCLKKKVIYTDGITPQQISAYLNTVNADGIMLAEDDLKKQDRQTDATIISTEMLLYKKLGGNPNIIDIWENVHKKWFAKGVGVRFIGEASRHTGQATTALGNVIVNLLVKERLVRQLGNKLQLMLVLGDDNIILTKPPITESMISLNSARHFNMQSEPSVSHSCGSYLRMTIYKNSNNVFECGPDFVRLNRRFQVLNGVSESNDDNIKLRTLSYCMMIGKNSRTESIVKNLGYEVILNTWYEYDSLIKYTAERYHTTSNHVEGLYNHLLNMMESLQVFSKTKLIFEGKGT